MKRMLWLLLLIPSLTFGDEWNGASTWVKTSDTDKVVVLGGFKSGYFDTVIDKFPWNEADRASWYGLLLQIDALQMYHAVTDFYANPDNKNVSPARAMRLCLESLIAKTREGPRLLAAIGVKATR